ncbi:MAG: HAD family hydrolase [Roseburia sp.]
MKKGIIFDMDGTLWDSAENVAKAWNRAIEESGFIERTLTSDDIKRVMGKTMDTIAKILFPELSEIQRVLLLESCCRKENEYLRQHGGMLYDGVEELFQSLREKYHVSIVSNCQGGYIEAFLDYYKLRERIDDFECYGNTLKQKADNIKLVVQRNHLEEAIYVGDIQGDYDASCEAGVGFIHAAYGFGTIGEDVAAIHSLKELPEVLEKMNF